MEKTKGIVMQTSKKVTAIYTEKGDFIEVPTPKEVPRVGDIIEVDIKRQRRPLHSQSWLKYTASAAVFLLVLALATFNLFALPNMAVASVSLDMNKGIEILVNKDGKVIEIRDVNGGANMVEGLSLTGQDPYQAINLIIENAVKLGELEESENLIFVRIVPLSKWFENNLNDETLKSSIEAEMSRLNLAGNLIVGESNEEVRKEALEHGMSVNDHIMYERFQENGIIIQPEALRDSDPKQVLSDTHMNVRDLFPGECTEIRSSMQSGRNESSSNSWDSEMGPKDYDYRGMESEGQGSSSMHNNGSNETSEDWHDSSTNSSNSTPQSPSADTTTPIPQSSSQQPPMTNPDSTEQNHYEEYWNYEREHNGGYNSSGTMDSWQDSTHNSDWSKNSSW